MDPVTIVGLVEGSIGLAVKCGSVAKSLNSLVGQYKYAKLTVSTMVQNLDIMQLAWDRIGAWSKDYMPTDSEDFTQRLERSLETGSLVLDALEEDLQSYDVSSMTFGQRSRLVWNETTLQGHQSRIQSMSLLLQAIQLPTPQATTNLLQQSEKQFMKSDESAFSIVPSGLSSRLSVSTDQTGGRDSIRSSASMVYYPLSFENDLFTARVYKRNYRSSRSRWLRKEEPDLDHESITPQKERRQNMSLGADVMTVQPSKASITSPTLWKGFNNNAEYLTHNAIMVTTSFRVTSEKISGSSSELDLHAELIEACGRGNNDRVKTLLRRRPEAPSPRVSRYCDSLHICPIHTAIFNRHVEVMETLLRHDSSKFDIGTCLGNTINCMGGNDGLPPLHVAAIDGNSSMVQLLLRYDASVNARVENGVQAIHLAARTGSTEVLASLIAAGADVNSVDRDGRQPLHYTLDSRGLPNIIRYLVERGANVNGLHDPTPLQLALTNNFAGNFEAPLSLGAFADEAPSFQCESALDTAIINGSLSSVEYLIKSRSDPIHCRVDGCTGLHTFAWMFYARRFYATHRLTALPRDKLNDQGILRLLLDHIDLLAKDQNGHSVLVDLFYRRGIMDEDAMLELARLFLDNLPRFKILEKTLLRSLMRNEERGYSEHGIFAEQVKAFYQCAYHGG